MPIARKFEKESDGLKRSWGFTEDDFLDQYLRRGENRWDVHPCRIQIRGALKEYCDIALPRRLSCLEIGCGSGNEFEGIEASGLVDFIAYTGIDICPKNIENALTRYPSVDFRVGDVFNGDLKSDSY